MGKRARTILLVEDEPIIALSEAHELRNEGYSVVVAPSGEAAIEKAAELGEALDLILFDIDLGPGLSGPEAARRILADRDVPIVFLSSHTESEVVHSSEAITSYGYVVKNSGITVLAASIRMAFRLHSANRELKRAEARMEDIVERVSDGFVAFDRDFNYTYVNRRGAELLGRPAAELIGKNYWLEYPEARDTPFAAAYRRAFETQEPIFLDEYYVHWDRWFSNRIYPSEEGITIFYSDSTERKRAELTLARSEERFRTLIEDSAIGAFIAQDGLIRYANPAAERMLAYGSGALVGVDPRVLSSPMLIFRKSPM